jgi:hypothetical protein
VPDEIAVGGGGLADGAEMDHRIDRRCAVEKIRQRARIDDPGRRMLAQVAPFSGRAEPVDDDGAGLSFAECGVHIRADETGAAGDQYHERAYRQGDARRHHGRG